MEAAIDMAESGHLVIGTLHTKSCAETIDRMINFYEVRDQAQIKNLLSSLLKVVVSQRLLNIIKRLNNDFEVLPTQLFYKIVESAFCNYCKFVISIKKLFDNFLCIFFKGKILPEYI